MPAWFTDRIPSDPLMSAMPISRPNDDYPGCLLWVDRVSRERPLHDSPIFYC